MTGHRPDIADVIDAQKMAGTPLLVAFLAALALLVDGYDVQVMALAVPSLARDWALPETSFGLALSGVVIGITLGSGFLGSLGDRYGRRTVLAVGLAGTGLATMATALATTPGQFVFWRVLTGLMLGAGLPNCFALASEFTPLRRRSMMVGLMNIASPLGAFSAGFLAPPVLEAFGWRGTFMLGGLAPLLVAAALLVLAPESLKFLAIRRPTDPRISAILRRIAPGLDPASVRLDGAGSAAATHGAWRELLSHEFRTRTLLLWAMLWLNLFNLYVLISWLPTLLHQAGWDMTAALRGAVLIQAGGIGGGIAISLFLDRGASRLALTLGFALAALNLAAFPLIANGGGWIALLLLAGAGTSGCQLALNALSAAYYPPAIKATGIGASLLVGGVGSIIGPLAGAVLIEQGLPATTILALLAVAPTACIAMTLLIKREWQAH